MSEKKTKNRIDRATAFKVGRYLEERREGIEKGNLKAVDLAAAVSKEFGQVVTIGTLRGIAEDAGIALKGGYSSDQRNARQKQLEQRVEKLEQTVERLLVDLGQKQLSAVVKKVIDASEASAIGGKSS